VAANQDFAGERFALNGIAIMPSSSTSHHALSDAQIDHFLAYGHVILSDCFSREAAQQLIDDAYNQLGYDPNDASTWAKPLVGVFPSHSTPLRQFSPQIWDAVCQLVGGEERVADPDCGLGQLIINFWRGRDEPWEAPSPRVKGWHKDGDFFRHFLDSPEQGLLLVPLLSDVAHKGGGTTFAADSVPVVARLLRDHPEGIRPENFDYPSLLAQCQDFRELTGQCGDVALIHPYLLHSFSQNHSGKPRFITNINIKLREPMNFNRPRPEEFSPVERGILRGLGMESLDFQITAPRESKH
jgi:hypothetical protein